jgi:hypothetical protein
MNIRAKLTWAFTALALVAVAGMATGGWLVLRARSIAQAREAFARTHGAIDRLLAQRYQVLEQIAKLSYLDPVIRAVTGSTDEADFGLARAEDDAARLEELHLNLVDASWDWSSASLEGSSFAIADYKGRVIYASASPGSWGGDTSVLPAVAEALADDDQLGSMVVAAADPRLAKLGLVRPGASGLLVVLVRAEVLRGKARACFIQLVAAAGLLGQAGEDETRIALVGAGGASDGDVPAAAVAAARAGEGDLVTVTSGGSTWLAQAYPLPGPGRREESASRPIGTVVVAQDLGAALAAPSSPAASPAPSSPSRRRRRAWPPAISRPAWAAGPAATSSSASATPSITWSKGWRNASA